MKMMTRLDTDEVMMLTSVGLLGAFTIALITCACVLG